ncbi:MAG TPA: hypothetical protein PKY46_05595 [Ignavibacteriaceae bacterium]|nr:hypothetical protein [Ignavibacteriaceae bacterium]
MKEKKSSCHDVMSHVCDTLGEDMNSPKCVEMRKHLESCTNCRNYFESVKSTITLFAGEEVEFPKEAHAELLKFLNLDKQ